MIILLLPEQALASWLALTATWDAPLFLGEFGAQNDPVKVPIDHCHCLSTVPLHYNRHCQSADDSTRIMGACGCMQHQGFFQALSASTLRLTGFTPCCCRRRHSSTCSTTSWTATC